MPTITIINYPIYKILRMISSLVFLHAVSAHAQVFSLEKWIVDGDRLFFVSNAGVSDGDNLWIVDDSIRLQSPIYSNPLDGMFRNAPIFWDTADSVVFQIRLYTDNAGMSHSQIRRYKVQALLNKEYTENNIYLRSLIDNMGIPQDYYIHRIDYGLDTLKGPLYFDFCVARDSFFVVSYLHDSRTVEVWNYLGGPFSPRNTEPPPTDGTLPPPTKKWNRLRVLPLTLDGPFRIVASKGATYLIDTKGGVYLLGHTKAEKITQLSALTSGGVLVWDKGADKVYWTERSAAETTARNIQANLKGREIEFISNKK